MKIKNYDFFAEVIQRQHMSGVRGTGAGPAGEVLKKYELSESVPIAGVLNPDDSVNG